ncbi:helix-turn-helix domain-containing protein, partial [Scytonema tolypothrichoides VB-61278_2]
MLRRAVKVRLYPTDEQK